MDGTEKKKTLFKKFLSTNLILFISCNTLIKIDVGNNIASEEKKSQPEINIKGVPNSKMPVPNIDCTIDVKRIIAKISKNMLI